MSHTELPPVSEDIISLAKEVAAMDDSEAISPGEWAKRLARDISKGRD